MQKCRTFALLALIAAAPMPAIAAGITLKSDNFKLPVSTRTFAGGKDAAAINANCVTCHSAGMVLTQPHLPKAAWDVEVHKMINAFKAPIDPAAVQPIIDYLAAMK